MTTVLFVLKDGALSQVFSNNENVDVKILDYDLLEFYGHDQDSKDKWYNPNNIYPAILKTEFEIRKIINQAVEDFQTGGSEEEGDNE